MGVSRCKLKRKSRNILLVGNGIWTVVTVGLDAGDSGSSLSGPEASDGSSLRVQPDDILCYLFPSSRFPASHMDGYSVLGGVLDNITHVDAFLLNQAPTDVLLTSVFGRLEDIFGNYSFLKLPGLEAT